ncbi:MAG: Fe-S cluster assembly protein SufB [Candidatus Gracilibacteria bacterium]|nr:Fe-S cluster assembly protein SufB [Candidatus Gracilibacteria bacterium]
MTHPVTSSEITKITPHIFEGLSREIFDGQDDIEYHTMALAGINETVVRQISKNGNEPDWMLQLRLKSLAIFESKPMPTWGPDLSGLDLQSIYYFAKPAGATDAKSWDDVPETIKNTFEKLGIPEAERQMLAGVGAQYDSEVVYHKLKDELVEQGVIFEDMSVAIHHHEELLKKYFMKAVPASDHKFAALHGAVWSGGTFLYVPKGVKITEPLQAYFRMNAKSGGQFEHTIIIIEDEAEAHYIEGCSAPKHGTSSLHAGCVEVYVGKSAKMRYSSVENWSIDTYNLNTKRAIVEEQGFIEWIGGNLGSGVTMLYPCSVLKGDDSKARHIGVAFANAGQVADTGAKVIHIGARTTSEVISKSLSKAGGVANYRGLVNILPSAKGAVSQVTCDGLLLDGISRSDTIPDIRVGTPDALVAQEASVGKISEATLAYLKSRGLDETKAKQMIVNGFLAPIVSELPLEYAVEMNILIGMELE